MEFLQRCSFVLLVTAITACGGGGGGGGSDGGSGGGSKDPTALTGTAATGGPLRGTVTLKDSAGATRSALIATGGGFTISTAGLTPPFLLLAEGSAGGRYHSITSAATASDVGRTVNVTPLTDLMVGQVARADGESVFAAGDFTAFTDSALASADTALKMEVSDVRRAAGDNGESLRTTPFVANHAGHDLALDLLTIQVDQGTHMITLGSRAGGPATSFALGDPLPGWSLDTAALQRAVADLAEIQGQIEHLTPYQNALMRFFSYSYGGFVLDSANADLPAAYQRLWNLLSPSFLHNGLSKEQYISKIAGITYQDGNYAKANAFGRDYVMWQDFGLEIYQEGTDTAVVWINGGVSPSPGNVGIPGALRMELKRESGAWKLRGNQQLADISIRPYLEVTSSYNRTTGATNSSTTTGLDIHVDTEDYLRFRHARVEKVVVTGPGLPGAGLVLTEPEIGAFEPAGSVGGRLAIADISAIHDFEPYTVSLWVNTDLNLATPPEFGGSSIVRIGRRPQAVANPTAQVPAFTNPASASALAGTHNSKLNVTWTAPEGLRQTVLQIDASTCPTGQVQFVAYLLADTYSQSFDVGFSFPNFSVCAGAGTGGRMSILAEDGMGLMHVGTLRFEQP